MQTEEWWQTLEETLDHIAEQKEMHEQHGLEGIEQYRLALVDTLYEINEKQHSTPIDELEAKPLNAAERFAFIAENSFHFMRYQQMKALRQELKKVNAVYQIRKKRQNKNS